MIRRTRTRPRTLLLPLVAALAAPLTATTARAQQPAGDKAAAEALFNEAMALVEKKRFAEACPKLAESVRLDPGIGAMLRLADCYENVHKTASAWAQFRETEDVARMQHDKRYEVARRHADRLEPLLSRLTVSLAPGAEIAGLTIERDGVGLGRAQWGSAVPVDPGTHAIVARAPGFKEWRSSVDVAANAARASVVVPVLEAEPAPVAATPPSPTPTPMPSTGGAPTPTPGTGGAPPAPSGAMPAGTTENDGTTQRMIGIATAAAGVVSIGVGSYFGLAAKSTYDDANAAGHCPANHCDAAGREARSTASGQATAATILFVAGGALVAGGVVLWVVAPHAGDPRGVAVHGAAAPGIATIGVTGRF